MTYPEYEAHIRSRRDYVRIARRDGSGERQVSGHGCDWEEEKGGDGGGGEEGPGCGLHCEAEGCEEAPHPLQVAFVQKRFHKDIFHNPVLMLNFCPEVEAAPGALQSVTREVLFLIDRSGAVSGPDVDRVKVRQGGEHRDPTPSWES